MIKNLSTLLMMTAALSILPLAASAATADVTVSSGQSVYISIAGTSDTNITVVNLSNHQTVASILAYSGGSTYNTSYTFSSSINSPASFAYDGLSHGQIDGLPAGNYEITCTSWGFSDYEDNYGSNYAEIELFNPYDSSVFIECDIDIY